MDEFKSIKIRAVLELFRESYRNGKPVAPGQGKYRAGHHFPWQDDRENYMGAVFFPENSEWLYPGSSAEVEIILVADSRLDAVLQPGYSWQVKEGPYLVGSATLIEVLSKVKH